MCIIHKGFRGFRTVSLASIFGGNLIRLKHAIPYKIIHSTLCNIKMNLENKSQIQRYKNLIQFIDESFKEDIDIPKIEEISHYSYRT